MKYCQDFWSDWCEKHKPDQPDYRAEYSEACNKMAETDIDNFDK